MEHDKVVSTLESIAKYQQETNIALVRMEGKLDKMEVAMDAKINSHRAKTDQELRELTRDLRELERYREKHEDEHKNDMKERSRFTWGLVVTALVAIGGWIAPHL